MTPLIADLGPWSWFILGVLLLAIEIVAPGTFLLWLGLSALMVGVLSLAINWGWQAQLVAFSVLAVLSVFGWWFLGRRSRPESDRPFLNRRAEAFVGRVFTLEKPIIDGSGTVRIDDTIWRVTGPDVPAGTKVRVARADGAILTVDRA